MHVFRHLLKEILIHHTRHAVKNRVARNSIIHMLRLWFA